MNAISNQFDLVVVASPAEAVRSGHVYHDGTIGLKIERVVVVNNGTEEGRPTVDIVMRDAEGRKYVAMTTGRLIAAIPVRE